MTYNNVHEEDNYWFIILKVLEWFRCLVSSGIKICSILIYHILLGIYQLIWIFKDTDMKLFIEPMF